MTRCSRTARWSSGKGHGAADEVPCVRGSCLELAGVAVGEAWRHSEEVEEGRGALVDDEGDGEVWWRGAKGSKEEVGRGGLAVEAVTRTGCARRLRGRERGSSGSGAAGLEGRRWDRTWGSLAAGWRRGRGRDGIGQGRWLG